MNSKDKTPATFRLPGFNTSYQAIKYYSAVNGNKAIARARLIANVNLR